MPHAFLSLFPRSFFSIYALESYSASEFSLRRHLLREAFVTRRLNELCLLQTVLEFTCTCDKTAVVIAFQCSYLCTYLIIVLGLNPMVNFYLLYTMLLSALQIVRAWCRPVFVKYSF